MNRRLAGALCASLLLVSPRPSSAFLYVGGSNNQSGDLIAIYVKNGFELILNLGPIEQLGQGNLTSFTPPNEFDGNLIGAKFTALGVPNRAKVYDHVLPPDPPTPQPNIALTTKGDASAIDPVHIGDAQAALESTSGTGWLPLLNTIGPAGSSGGQVLQNTDDTLEIAVDLPQSYTKNIGFASDTIASTPSIPSTAVVIDPQGTGTPYAIPLYTVTQDVKQDLSGLLTLLTNPGSLGGDNGISGNAMLSLAPEPGSSGLAGAVVAGLCALARRRRRLYCLIP